MHLAGRAAAIALACIGLISDAPASVTRYLPLDELATGADSIVAGEVVGVQSRMALRRNRIHTYVTIRVDRFLKGDAGRSFVTLRLLGGSAEGFRLVVSGMPEFRLGEDVLVFVEQPEGGAPGVFGLSAGKFSLSPRPGGPVLDRTLAGLTVVDAGTNPAARFAASRTPATLAEVESVIARALAAAN